MGLSYPCIVKTFRFTPSNVFQQDFINRNQYSWLLSHCRQVRTDRKPPVWRSVFIINKFLARPETRSITTSLRNMIKNIIRTHTLPGKIYWRVDKKKPHTVLTEVKLRLSKVSPYFLVDKFYTISIISQQLPTFVASPTVSYFFFPPFSPYINKYLSTVCVLDSFT